MPEEKLLFTEKELTRLKRPEPPKPGTALVFVGDGTPLLTVREGERGPTAGELLFGKYSTYYEVDMGDRSLNFHEKLPCADAFEFNTEVKLTYAVSDPALVVRRARTDAGQFLKDLAIDAMRRASRRYNHEQTGEAENTIACRIEDEVRDNGFKLSRAAFVKISLDEAIQTRLINKKLKEYDFDDQKTQISRDEELANLQLGAKLGLKGKKADFFAPYIKAGDWATLLAMLDLNDPEDVTIRAMVEATSNKQKMQEERQQKLLELAIEKGAVEGWELRGAAKALFQEVSGLPEQSIALLEGKTQPLKSEDSQQTKEIEVKPSIPNSIGRDRDEDCQ
ncbi:hypothetical protein [Chamaesiphon sp. VAR_69_metabat_338]|uniref:hypothetical protein n=1 Tax=Chamaesiphon sp. VAR_69_metabat_338 TaxID=2964704 RepID=UPI00286E5B47|nr:hypothetical protein [Chamaesiphon sp. VAR_69_metabat_338]